MLAVGAAGAAGSVAASAGSAVFSKIAGEIFGSFNPKYKKLDRKRIRYIQSKYAIAYGGNGENDCNEVITSIDNDSKLKMTEDGLKPANPFANERAFDDALVMHFYPVPGHQGKFCASHAKAALGVIIEYQNQRRRRLWVPKVSSPGRPNDYINMFLEEMKAWLRNQLTLDNVSAEELERRHVYITKLKHDNYYWCFPNELGEHKIHNVIDYVHERVSNALEVVHREERNKSLQTLFMELNDHTLNGFEFGKSFLAYILFSSKPGGANLVHSKIFDGSTYERGKLHRLLDRATSSVMKLYVSDMRDSDRRMDALKEGPEHMYTPPQGPTPTLMISNGEPLSSSVSEESRSEYDIEISEHFRDSRLSAVIFNVLISEVQSKTRWAVRKTYKDFVELHKKINADFETTGKPLYLPTKYSTVFPRKEEIAEVAVGMRLYLLQAVDDPESLLPATKTALCTFIGVKSLVLPEKSRLVKAETVPNFFVELKKEFQDQLMDTSTEGGLPKSLLTFREVWGVDYVTKIFDAHALLQRMATILGWTLEINHFFVSMFGNTLAFSKLPLKEVLATQKDIMNRLLALTTDIFDYTCDLNAQQGYKWHKNLQTSENELKRMRHHLEKAVQVISRIEAEHLDYQMQMRRLQDVAARFAPMMNRLDGFLPSIQRELDLPVTSTSHSLPQGGRSASPEVLLLLQDDFDRDCCTTDAKTPVSGDDSGMCVHRVEEVLPPSVDDDEVPEDRLAGGSSEEPDGDRADVDRGNIVDESKVCAIS